MLKSILFLTLVIIVMSCKSAVVNKKQKTTNPLVNNSQFDKHKVLFNADSTTVKFKGIITNIKYDCRVDGLCSIEVNNKWQIAIIYGKRDRSMIPKECGLVTGISFFPEDPEIIGKKVTVFAKIWGENRLTVEGSKVYYVKVIK
jgi:hypothetical protein